MKGWNERYEKRVCVNNRVLIGHVNSTLIGYVNRVLIGYVNSTLIGYVNSVSTERTSQMDSMLVRVRLGLGLGYRV